jgi:hypothetical protein
MRLDARRSGALNRVMPRFELDPREADAFVRGMEPRQELIYRLAVRGLCPRCRGDRQFRARTEELVFEFRKDIGAVLREADALAAELTASPR